MQLVDAAAVMDGLVQLVQQLT
jgi:hypothetical protein